MRGALLRLRRSTLVAARSVCAPALAPAAPRVRSSGAAMAAAAAEDDLERAVGITGFASDAPGFTAVLKHRRAPTAAHERPTRCALVPSGFSRAQRFAPAAMPGGATLW